MNLINQPLACCLINALLKQSTGNIKHFEMGCRLALDALKVTFLMHFNEVFPFAAVALKSMYSVLYIQYHAKVLGRQRKLSIHPCKHTFSVTADPIQGSEILSQFRRLQAQGRELP